MTIHQKALDLGSLEYNKLVWYRFPNIQKAREFTNYLYNSHDIVGTIHKKSNTVFLEE